MWCPCQCFPFDLHAIIVLLQDSGGQRPSQQGCNRPCEPSAASEIPQENSLRLPSPDREPSCTSHYERRARHLTARWLFYS